MISKCQSLFREWLKNLSLSEYTEKDAIRGHSVDRYAYALQLIQDGTNESLTKAYAWLLVASEDIDRKKPAKLLLHQLQFRLKQLGVFERAEKTGEEYMYLYSAEGTMKALRASKNPVNYLLRSVSYLMDFFITRVGFLDKRIIQNKGNLTTWIIIGFISWCSMIGSGWLFVNNSSIFTALPLTLSLLCMLISGCICENRYECQEENK